MVIAAFVALIRGRCLSFFGAGGGGAATCGEAASAESSCEVVVVAGITTGGVSPNGRGRR